MLVILMYLLCVLSETWLLAVSLIFSKSGRRWQTLMKVSAYTQAITLQDLIYTSRNSHFILCAITYYLITIDSRTVLYYVFTVSLAVVLFYTFNLELIYVKGLLIKTYFRNENTLQLLLNINKRTFVLYGSYGKIIMIEPDLGIFSVIYNL